MHPDGQGSDFGLSNVVIEYPVQHLRQCSIDIKTTSFPCAFTINHSGYTSGRVQCNKIVMVISSSDPVYHRKPCTLCDTPRDVLIRCQIDATKKWHFVCPGKCWTQVSGGVVDGDTNHPEYKYGGAWKNKHAGVSAKKPKKKSKGKEDRGDVEGLGEWDGVERRYTTNDKVTWDGKVWMCRKSHVSSEDGTPEKAISMWKEVDQVLDQGEGDYEDEVAGSGPSSITG